MKTLFIQLKPYVHEKNIAAYKQIKVTDYRFENDKYGKRVCVIEDTDGRIYSEYNAFEHESPVKGINVTDLEVLPFFSDVIEDLPSSAKFEPKEFKRAQLMVERRGAYQFYKHPDSEEPLLIAINSHSVSQYLK